MREHVRVTGETVALTTMGTIAVTAECGPSQGRTPDLPLLQTVAAQLMAQDREASSSHTAGVGGGGGGGGGGGERRGQEFKGSPLHCQAALTPFPGTDDTVMS